MKKPRIQDLTPVLLAAWAASAAPAAAQMTDLERQHLVAHMEMTAGWLADEVSGLNDAQFTFRPASGQWSVAENLEHLVMVAEIYWNDLQSALKEPPRRRSAMTDADVLWYGIDRSRREQAIPPERPPGKLRDLRTALERYRKRHDRLLQYVKTTRDDLRSHIVDRQACDAYQWALLISTHEQRHILQIREIKAHPEFPTRGKELARGVSRRHRRLGAARGKTVDAKYDMNTGDKAWWIPNGGELLPVTSDDPLFAGVKLPPAAYTMPMPPSPSRPRTR